MTGQRGPRNRKAADTAQVQATSDVPELPVEYDARTRNWWLGILELPHVARFGAGEWQIALRGAFVLDMCWAKPSAALLAEVRRIEVALGVTHGDRERLGISDAPPPAEKPAASRNRARPDPRESPA